MKSYTIQYYIDEELVNGSIVCDPQQLSNFILSNLPITISSVRSMEEIGTKQKEEL